MNIKYSQWFHYTEFVNVPSVGVCLVDFETLFCNHIDIYFQGASSSFPSFYCDVSLERLRTHGKEKKEHNFLSPPCQLREFGRMEQHLKDQISDVDDLENFAEVSDFVEYVNTEENHDIERQFREKGKHHNSIIGSNNSPIDSMHYAMAEISTRPKSAFPRSK